MVVVDEEKRKKTDVDEEDSDSEWKEADPGNLHNIIGDVSETESEKEVQHKEKDQEEVHIGRIYRKPTVPLPIFAPKRKEPFVSSSGLQVYSVLRQRRQRRKYEELSGQSPSGRKETRRSSTLS